MSRKCDICHKGALQANSVSHAHNITKRKQQPNLQTVTVTAGGRRRQITTCTRCLKSGKIYTEA